MVERRKWWLKSPLSFFGLQAKNKLDIHEEIFNLIFYSKGGFTFTEAYNLPITLRRFYLRRLNKEYEDTNKAMEKQQKKTEQKYKQRK
jgi:hypothetical protein